MTGNMACPMRRREETLGRYNLLDEKWISVIRGIDGQTELVSLKELFANAQNYYDLSGEMKTQDFSILRFLLAVLHTVFSRFDVDGSPYPMIKIDEERYRQLGPVIEDLEEYEDALFDTWLNLWERKCFPEIIQDYLEKWRDHFNLFDEKYPFYQVTKEDIEELADGGGQFFGKNLNRTVSESNNKIALFSPTGSVDENKDRMTYDQLVRWLITFQGYTGTGDKKKVKNTTSTCSKGWLFDLGGVYLQGKNLFETLMLNCCLSTIGDEGEGQWQIPSWERSPREHVDIYFKREVNNLASLYTNWSRIIYFDQNYEEDTPFQCAIAKLPEINHVGNFLEPMTCWAKANNGPNKGFYVPKKHRPEEAMWRNFSALLGFKRGEESSQRPGIIQWYGQVSSDLEEIAYNRITICGISMKDDGNATSWSPTDEIADSINLSAMVAADLDDDGWLYLINKLIGRTEETVQRTLKSFLLKISQIRGYDKKDTRLIHREMEEFYQRIDASFREWLYSIEISDSKDDQSRRWYGILEEALLEFGFELFSQSNTRDMKGIRKDKKVVNIATAYDEFRRHVYKEFHREG